MKKRNRKHHFKILNLSKLKIKNKIFTLFLSLVLLSFLYIKYIASPIVVANTEAQLSAFATRSINTAVAETMKQNLSYDDLINVVKDENNAVSFIETNSVRINLLSKSMSKLVMKTFLELAKNPLKISLGSFSGISIFAGAGPKIAYKVSPFGEVYCYFNSNFESAGINQTYHKIYLDIAIKVSVVFPLRRLIVNSASEVLLCETLIVGKIPEVYLNASSLSDMLDLIPERFG